MKLYLGRLIDHLHLVVSDIEASKVFYRGVLGALGIAFNHEAEDYFSADELFVSSLGSHSFVGQLTGRVHLAFQAQSQDAVQAFHAAGLKVGARDNGAPGERHYHTGYYAAFLLDPDGNNVEAVFHGPATRSAAAVEVSY